MTEQPTVPSGPPARSRVTLTGISSRAWEHPADRGALVALRKLKGFDTVVKGLSGLIREPAWRLMYLGSSVKVDDRQFPTLHRLLGEVGQTLDVAEMPELYVQASPFLNASTLGMNKPFIVVNSALLDLLDEEELRFILGHELGHAISGHAVYRTLLEQLISLTGVLNSVPGGALGVRGIVAALYEWSRKAELSADRAGLLATQDPSAGFRALMKLASGGYLEDIDPTSFFEQGAEYEASDMRESVLKLLLVERRTHPFPVVRASDLRRWVDSGEYTSYLAGDYPRRDEDDAAKVTDAAQDAANSYSETFRQTQDTLGRFAHDVAGFLGSARTWLDDQLRGAPPLTLAELFRRLPEGWSEVTYDGRRWGASRAEAAGGRVVKVYAEELGGVGVVSANLYLTASGEELRPCEMPAEVVLGFLAGLRIG